MRRYFGRRGGGGETECAGSKSGADGGTSGGRESYIPRLTHKSLSIFLAK